MNELGGLAQRMPHTTMWWLIGVGSMVGIPLMSGFVSKWMLYAAALQAGCRVRGFGLYRFGNRSFRPSIMVTVNFMSGTVRTLAIGNKKPGQDKFWVRGS